MQFVSMGAFFAVIADPAIGGTYMTLLNAISNFGGTYPHFFALRAVDFFTVSECVGTSTTHRMYLSLLTTSDCCCVVK